MSKVLRSWNWECFRPSAVVEPKSEHRTPGDGRRGRKWAKGEAIHEDLRRSSYGPGIQQEDVNRFVKWRDCGFNLVFDGERSTADQGIPTALPSSAGALA